MTITRPYYGLNLNFRRSIRIHILNRKKIEKAYYKIMEFMTQLRYTQSNHQVLIAHINSVNYIIQIYKIILDTFTLFQRYEPDAGFTRYLYTAFKRGFVLKNQMRLYIEHGNKPTNSHTLFHKLFNKFYIKIMKHFRDKLDALTTRVWLNDDVVYLIYSYI